MLPNQGKYTKKTVNRSNKNISNNINSKFNNKVNKKNIYNNNNNNNNSNNLKNEISKSEENDLAQKLNYIYESINNITFDNLEKQQIGENYFNNLAVREINNKNENSGNNENDEIINKEIYFNEKSLFYTENDEYLLKLKIFNALKQYCKKRKEKKPFLAKKIQLKKTAETFYINLLKSRVLYGFYIIQRRKNNFFILKDRFVDYRINELSKYFFYILIGVANYKRQIKYFREKQNFKNINFIFQMLKNGLNFNKTYYKIYMSKILNNIYAVKFMNIICELSLNNNIKTKSDFENNYKNLLLTEQAFTYKKYIGIFFAVLKNQKNNSKILNIKFEQIRNYIFANSFFRDIKEKIKLKNKIFFYCKKLFFIRYYIKLFLKQKYKKEFNNKKRIFKLRNGFKTLLFQVYKKMNHKMKINNIIKTKLKSSKKNKSDVDVIDLYNINLKKKLFNILLKNVNVKRNINYLHNYIFYNDMKRFFKRMTMKTIGSLLIQGIREKYNLYLKEQLIKDLLYIYFEKIKEKTTLKLRNKYLKVNILHLFQNNVAFKVKNMHLLLKLYFTFFKQKITLKKNFQKKNKVLNINNNKKLFFRKIKIKIHVKKQRKLLIKKIRDVFIKKEHKNIILSFFKKALNKNKKNNSKNPFYNKTKIFYSKILLYKIKKGYIKNMTLNKNFDKILQKKLQKHYATFINNINNKIITKSLFIVKNKFILRSMYFQFLGSIKNDFKLIRKNANINKIIRKYYANKLVDGLVVCYKTKCLYEGIDKFYKTKIEKKVFDIYKKNYLDKIKFNMISCRYNEYLIASYLGKLILIKMDKNNKLYANSNISTNTNNMRTFESNIK